MNWFAPSMPKLALGNQVDLGSKNIPFLSQPLIFGLSSLKHPDSMKTKLIFFSSALCLIATSSTVKADETFSRHDANRDSKVTYEELARSKKMEFDKLDRNRDKAVTSEEFAAATEEAGSTEEKAEMDLFATPGLASIDADGSQSASLAEYGAFVKETINQLDTTADNAVSMEEYQAAVTIEVQKAAAAAAPKGSAPKGSAPKPAE